MGSCHDSNGNDSGIKEIKVRQFMLLIRLSLFRIFFALTLIFLQYHSVIAQSDRDWKSYTSAFETRDAVRYQNSVWYATGGGVTEFSLQSRNFSLFSNTDGISNNQCGSITVDTGGGRIIASGSDGVLNFFSLSSRQWQLVSSLTGTLINDMSADGDSLFIATSGSFVLFDLEKLSVIGIAARLGTLNSGTQVLSSVSDSRYIWCMTSNSIAKANRYQSNFQSPAAWTVYSNNQGLTSASMKSFVVYQDQLYVSTNNQRIFRFNDLTGWFEAVTGNLPSGNYTLLAQGEDLYAYNASSVYRYETGTWENLNLTLSDSLGNSFSIRFFTGSVGGKNTLISDRSDICVYDDAWKCYTPNTPRANYFSGLKFDSQRNLWCSSLSAYGIPGPGFYKLDTRNDKWENFHSSGLPDLPTNNFQNVTVDDSGKIWLGSWSHGLAAYNPATKTVRKIDYTNGLAIYQEPTGQCNSVTMINNIFKGPGNNILISVNKPCDTERALAVYHPATNQFYYYTPSKLLNCVNPFRILYDSYGQYWVTTYAVDIVSIGKGLLILRPSGSLLDVSSTSVVNYTINDGLISNNTTAIAEDRDYTLWIGTDVGLQSYNGFFSTKYEYPDGPKGEYIKDIHVDKFNNKWIATAEGVSLLTSNGNWVHYNISNSRIVDNNIISITSDPDGLYLYFGSYNKGLSRLKNPLASASAGENVTVYPNPFIIGQHDYVSFLSVPDKSNITIMTLAGEIVKKISVATITASVTWDGKNGKGQNVASGIYIYHVYPSESASIRFRKMTGKIAVIRK